MTALDKFELNERTLAFLELLSEPKITNLLGWNLKSLGPHVDFLVHVHTRNDKEHTRPPGPSCQKPAQSEDDRPLILLMWHHIIEMLPGLLWLPLCSSNLNHLDHKEEGERERNDDHYHGDDCQQQRTNSGPLLANWKMGTVAELLSDKFDSFTKRFLTSLPG